MPVEASNTTDQPSMISSLPLIPRLVCDRLLGAMSHSGLIAVAVDQCFAFVVVGAGRHAVTDPADAHVVGAEDGDAMPGQRAGRGREIVQARARIGGGCGGGRRARRTILCDGRMIRSEGCSKHREGAPPDRSHRFHPRESVAVTAPRGTIARKRYIRSYITKVSRASNGRSTRERDYARCAEFGAAVRNWSE